MTHDLEARLREMATEWAIRIPASTEEGWYETELLAFAREVAALAAHEQRERDARMVESGVRPNYYARALAAAIRATAPEIAKEK